MDSHADFPYPEVPESRMLHATREQEGQTTENVEGFVYPSDSILVGLHNWLGLPVTVREERIDDNSLMKKLKVLTYPKLVKVHSDFRDESWEEWPTNFLDFLCHSLTCD